MAYFFCKGSRCAQSCLLATFPFLRAVISSIRWAKSDLGRSLLGQYGGVSRTVGEKNLNCSPVELQPCCFLVGRAVIIRTFGVSYWGRAHSSSGIDPGRC